jgi:precorrin-6A/cobalt-precorrin-6A reductase
MGVRQVRAVPLISGPASDRWRAPPNTICADWIRSRARLLRPSTPSSPMPTTDSQWPAAGVGARAELGDPATWAAAGNLATGAAATMLGSASAMAHVLILGGTTEARELGLALKARDIAVTISLAGRTAAPAAQPAPVRRGGFGGPEGLAEYLRVHKVDYLVDATHPYAETISANAVHAAVRTNIPILALRRPPWVRVPGDTWVDVVDAEDAVRALGEKPRRVFLGIGRQELTPFAAAPQHYYVVRSVDPVEPPLGVPHVHYILARGPFTERDDKLVFESFSIDAIVAKNSGGEATYSKIAAARSLGVSVYMFKRPPVLDCPAVATVAEAVAWLDHAAGLSVPAGAQAASPRGV